MLRRWQRFTGLLDEGRICLTKNAAGRALRGFALGRRSGLFAGSERGAATMATLIATAKLNDIDPLVWLADVLARIAATPQTRLHELLPWNWHAKRTCSKQPDRGPHRTVTEEQRHRGFARARSGVKTTDLAASIGSRRRHFTIGRPDRAAWTSPTPSG
jgi:hypothetical protein